MVCLSPSDDEMLCWEAAQFIKHTVVSGLLSLPALTASQCLFTSSKYDRLYVYLTVCLCECACAEVKEEVVCLRGGVRAGVHLWRFTGGGHLCDICNSM